MERKTLSARQLQVMEILWNAKGCMTASAIVKEDGEMQINTVQASLRSLLAKGYIKVGDIVYSGTVLSRSYEPLMTREEYLEMSCQKLSRISSSSLIVASLINSEEDEAMLDELERLIQERRKVLEAARS